MPSVGRWVRGTECPPSCATTVRGKSKRASTHSNAFWECDTSVWIKAGCAALPADWVVSCRKSSNESPNDDDDDNDVVLLQHAFIPELAFLELPPTKCSFSIITTCPPRSKMVSAAAKPATPLPTTMASGVAAVLPRNNNPAAGPRLPTMPAE